MRNIILILAILFVSSCRTPETTRADWLLGAGQYPAQLKQPSDHELLLTNGLVSRTFRLTPNAATIGLNNLMTGASLLRAVKPEALLVLNGDTIEVGGLTGQPDHAFLLPSWIDSMTGSDRAMHFTGFETGKIQPRMEWKEVRHHAPDVVWPPKGVELRMKYRMPSSA
ncbi:MAG: hypothetical protein J7L89_03145, partial [Bacteroidales bacterium]|nr:hypothetical protein [Bacteroidales bacterium]